MIELIDIVNENDRIIGQENIIEAHKKGLLHRGVTIILYNDWTFQKILVQKRSQQHYKNPGLLGFTGGHIPTGMSYKQGAKHELETELFHNRKKPEIKIRKLFKFLKTADEDKEIMQVYRGIYRGNCKPDPAEVESIEWMPTLDLIRNTRKKPEKYTGTTKQIVEELVRRYFCEKSLNTELAYSTL